MPWGGHGGGRVPDWKALCGHRQATSTQPSGVWRSRYLSPVYLLAFSLTTRDCQSRVTIPSALCSTLLSCHLTWYFTAASDGSPSVPHINVMSSRGLTRSAQVPPGPPAPVPLALSPSYSPLPTGSCLKARCTLTLHEHGLLSPSGNPSLPPSPSGPTSLVLSAGTCFHRARARELIQEGAASVSCPTRVSTLVGLSNRPMRSWRQRPPPLPGLPVPSTIPELREGSQKRGGHGFLFLSDFLGNPRGFPMSHGVLDP